LVSLVVEGLCQQCVEGGFGFGGGSGLLRLDGAHGTEFFTEFLLSIQRWNHNGKASELGAVDRGDAGGFLCNAQEVSLAVTARVPSSNTTS
jgi:hypothetical protein